MGDKVQTELEALLPTILELKSKELFTDKEIRQIVRKRRDFEYRLVGNAKKQDYLEYIQYETALESLRKQRALDGGHKLNAVRSSSGLSHLLRIFNRCVKIWPQDKFLWNQYVDFCFRSGSTKRVLSVLLQALAYHPGELNYWLLAADRELQLGHLEAPRRLMQLAIRQLPSSVKLWEEYFKFEVKCALQLASAKMSKLTDNSDTVTPIGVGHLRVVLKAATRQLAEDDIDRFLACCLDIFTHFYGTLDSELITGLDSVENQLYSILVERGKNRPLIGLLLWKLQMLSIVKSSQGKLSIKEALMKLEELEMIHENDWIALLLMLNNILSSVASNAIENCPANSAYSISQNYFSTIGSMDSVHDYIPDSSFNSINKHSKDYTSQLLTDPFHPDFIQYTKTHNYILQRCLALNLNSEYKGLLQTNIVTKSCCSTPDTSILHRLNREKSIIGNAFQLGLSPVIGGSDFYCYSGSQESLASAVCHWAVKQTLARPKAEWHKTLIVLCRIIYEIVPKLEQLDFIHKILDAIDSRSIEECSSTNIASLYIFKAELELFLSHSNNHEFMHPSAQETTYSCENYSMPPKVHNNLLQCFKQSSSIPFPTITRAIFVLSLHLRQHMLAVKYGKNEDCTALLDKDVHMTLDSRTNSSSGKTQSNKKCSSNDKIHNSIFPSSKSHYTEMHTYLAFWINKIYGACPNECFAQCAALIVNHLLLRTAAPRDITINNTSNSLLAREWNRIMETSNFGRQLLPVNREIIRRIVSFGIIVERLHFLFATISDDNQLIEEFVELCVVTGEAICHYFNLLIQHAVEYDNSCSTAASPTTVNRGTNSSFFSELIPDALVIQSLVLRYISVALCLETASVLSDKPEHVNRPRLGDVVIQQLHQILKHSPSLSATVALYLAQCRQRVQQSATLESIKTLIQEEIVNLSEAAYLTVSLDCSVI